MYSSDGPGGDSGGPGGGSGGPGGGSGGPGRFETLISYEGFSSKGSGGVFRLLVYPQTRALKELLRNS